MANKFLDFDDSEIRFFMILVVLLSVTFTASLVISSKIKNKEASTPVAINNFQVEDISAKAVFVYDVRNQTVLFAKNENTRLPLASLTKVMTALVAEELKPNYTTVTITQDALTPEGDSGLVVAEKWSLKNLLDYSLVTSSNDGIHAVALALGALNKANASTQEVTNDFVERMNTKAHDLGLNNTYYFNDTGLDESNLKGGAYGTAREMAQLFDYIIKTHPGLMAATSESVAEVTSLDNKVHIAKNTNLAISDIPGLIASKTGFTDNAGGNLVFAFDPDLGRPIIISILGSTQEGRFDDAKKLVAATLSYLDNNK